MSFSYWKAATGVLLQAVGEPGLGLKSGRTPFRAALTQLTSTRLRDPLCPWGSCCPRQPWLSGACSQRRIHTNSSLDREVVAWQRCPAYFGAGVTPLGGYSAKLGERESVFCHVAPWCAWCSPSAARLSVCGQHRGWWRHLCVRCPQGP